jgi:hypothetical protein
MRGRLNLRIDTRALSAAVACDAPWQRALMAELGRELWTLVHSGTGTAREVGGSFPPWASPIERPPDFRFVNIASVDLEQLAHELAAGLHTEESARFAFDQFISRFDYHAFDPELRAVVRALRRTSDLKLALRLFRDQRRLAADVAEPRDLFFLA